MAGTDAVNVAEKCQNVPFIIREAKPDDCGTILQYIKVNKIQSQYLDYPNIMILQYCHSLTHSVYKLTVAIHEYLQQAEQLSDSYDRGIKIDPRRVFTLLLVE